MLLTMTTGKPCRHRSPLGSLQKMRHHWQRYVQPNFILINFSNCWHHCQCIFFFFQPRIKIEFRPSWFRKPVSIIMKTCSAFNNSDLPAGTLRNWQTFYLPTCYQHLSTLKDPWSLSDLLPEAQCIWDKVFPDNAQTLAGTGEPIFYLVWFLLSGILLHN